MNYEEKPNALEVWFKYVRQGPDRTDAEDVDPWHGLFGGPSVLHPLPLSV